MRKNLLKISLLACIALLFIRSSVKKKTTKDIFESFITSLFQYSYGDLDPKYFPDTTLKITVPDYNKNPETQYARVQCGSSPASMLSRMLWAFAGEEYEYNSKMRTEFKGLFGADILTGTFKTANDQEFRLFNSAGILAAFNKVYHKPNEKYKQWLMQKVYDVTMKNFMRDVGNIVVKVMSQKPEFEKISADYLLKAKTDKAFEGQELGFTATDKLLGKESSKIYTCIGEYRDYYPDRIVCFMIRRQCDGSLPTILSCLKRTLADYDPDFSKEISSKF